MAETGQPYAYTGDDPLNASDPLGLQAYRLPRYWTRDSLPRVRNPQLERSLKNLWKYDPEEHVGNGSSVAALEEEAESGKATRGVFHEQSVENDLNGLGKALKQNLNAGDRVVANDAYEYASSALRSFDDAVAGGKIPIGSDPGELPAARASASLQRFQTYATGFDGADSGIPPAAIETGSVGGEAAGGGSDPGEFIDPF